MIDLALIQAASTQHGVDAALIQAITEHESGGESYRTRFEPAWRYFLDPAAYASRLDITADTERVNQATSWGPMQVMGSVARELGFSGLLTELTDAQTGLYWGVLKLKHLLTQYDETDAISAYNAGSPRKTPGGQYVNASAYVDPICRRLRELRAIP